MAIHSRRFAVQGAGVALAAILVASVSVHNHEIGASAQGGVVLSGMGLNSNGLIDRQSEGAQPARVDYALLDPKLIHHFPT